MYKVGRVQSRTMETPALGGSQAQVDISPQTHWVPLLMMSIRHCCLQKPSSIAGSIQPSKSPGVSCLALLIHLPDPRPSPQRDEVVWPFSKGKDSSPGTKPLFWQPTQFPSYGFLFFSSQRQFPPSGIRGDSRALSITLWMVGGVRFHSQSP